MLVVTKCYLAFHSCEQHLRMHLSTSMRRCRLNETLRSWFEWKMESLLCTVRLALCISVHAPSSCSSLRGGPWWDACTHRQLIIVAIAHYCPPDDLDPPGGSLVLWHRRVRQPLQALIGGMKYCRRKLKGPSVKIIHDMHIFPSWWNRWYLD